MRESGIGQLNTRQIELHLKSAVDALTPDVLDRIDLSTPQMEALEQDQAAILRLQRRMRGFAAVAAACICLVFTGGGACYYHMENGRVESVIGIDVNPSVEISINRKERVLEARALNEDAAAIMEGMDLKGVDLNVAVNAVVGSMVTHGYLDDLDNAILVTVSNDSVRKAKELRASVVGDVERTLKENQVEAVVYDQQVIEDEEMEALAREYGISYGKAYFLKELIDQNDSLDIKDMEELSSMTMEEIAHRITESSYALGELADQAAETSKASTEAETVTEPVSTEETTEEETTTEPESTEAMTSEPETTAPPETTKAPEEESESEPIEIDYVDYEDGTVYVCFMERVKWKKPSVVVRDDEGNSYAAVIMDTSRNDCSFEVDGLAGGKSYTFVLGGLCRAEGDTSVTVRGYFEKPEIADGAEDDEDSEEEFTTEEEKQTTASGTEEEPESSDPEQNKEETTERQEESEEESSSETEEETEPREQLEED